LWRELCLLDFSGEVFNDDLVEEPTSEFTASAVVVPDPKERERADVL